MGFDPAFYYHRPINIYAAHSYGPVLLATELNRSNVDATYVAGVLVRMSTADKTVRTVLRRGQEATGGTVEEPVPVRA